MLVVLMGCTVTPIGWCSVLGPTGHGHAAGSLGGCSSQPGQDETGKRKENRQISASTAAGVNVKQMGSSTPIILTS